MLAIDRIMLAIVLRSISSRHEESCDIRSYTTYARLRACATLHTRLARSFVLVRSLVGCRFVRIAILSVLGSSAAATLP